MSATPDSTLANPEQRIADLERQLADCQAERDEARRQQTATAEVLRVISASPTDLQPTLNAIAAHATILTGAANACVSRFDSSLIHPVAYYGWTDEEIEAVQRDYPRPPGMESTTGRAILTREVVHVPDASIDPEYGLQSVLQKTRMRTGLSVPILQDGNPVGAITVGRREVAPFSQTQIDLLKTFADQAVIAIENARLFNETREALEQQTATAEVLQVINSSPGDLARVFDAILDKAHTLCEAAIGALLTFDGESFDFLARKAPTELAGITGRPFKPGPQDRLNDLIRGEPLLHIDAREVLALAPEDPQLRAIVEVGGMRTYLAVPLRKDDRLIGAITAARQEVRPFTEKQIALLQNFAAQAVIAMENARLLTETREALEQQTATAQVLGVINSSPGDLSPVFDAMLEKATTLCGAAFGTLATYDGSRFTPAAAYGVPAAFADFRSERGAFAPPPGSSLERVVNGESLVHIADVAVDPGQAATPLVQLGGCRALLCVALHKDNNLVGAITAYRQEPRPFTDKQIALGGISRLRR